MLLFKKNICVWLLGLLLPARWQRLITTTAQLQTQWLKCWNKTVRLSVWFTQFTQLYWTKTCSRSWQVDKCLIYIIKTQTHDMLGSGLAGLTALCLNQTLSHLRHSGGKQQSRHTLWVSLRVEYQFISKTCCLLKSCTVHLLLWVFNFPYKAVTE